MKERCRSAPDRDAGAGPRDGLAAWIDGSWFPAVVLLLFGILAYANSFRGQYQFDDFVSIVSNPNIRHLGPIGRVIEAPRDQPIAGRPTVAISLALNYAVSGLRVWSYHAFNLLIHLLAGLTLFALVRHTLRLPRIPDSIRARSSALALCIGLIWTIHPLQTESVTYISERAEAMGGLFFLLTILASVRFIRSGSRRGRVAWFTAATTASAVGMATKEIVATAPVMLLLYDRIFLARTFREIFRARWRLYAALGCTWGILIALMSQAPRGGTTGFELPDLTPLQQIRTQPGVILHYLRLAFWPHPLVLDYGWPVAHNPLAIAVTGIVVLTLLALIVIALFKCPPVGFLGLWFFVILAPTSSFVPVQPICFEHRMYLPLAAVVTLTITGGFAWGPRLLARRHADPVRRRGAGRAIAIATLAPIVLLLGWRTVLRNHDYADEVVFCRKDAVARPENAHAHRNLGLALVHNGRYEEAIPSFRRAIELQPVNATAHCNLAGALASLGRTEEAEEQYAEAIRQRPSYPEALYNLGLIEMGRGNLVDAERNLREALRINPGVVEAYTALGNLEIARKRSPEAIELFRQAVRLRPDHGEAQSGLARALLLDGRADQALATAQEGVRLNPSSALSHKVLGDVLLSQEQPGFALREYASAVALDPADADSRWLLGRLLAAAGRESEAVSQYRALLRLRPDHDGALNALAWILATSRDAGIRNGAEALELATRACAATGNEDPFFLDTQAAAYAETGRFPEAIATMERAIALLATANHAPDLGAEFRARLDIYRRHQPVRT
jgi:protein O-mannosyl-transferase